MRIRLLLLLAVIGLISSVTTNAGADSPVNGDTAQPLPEVSVFAKRLKLEEKITNFIYGITALENYEGLARWKRPVCPLVSGLAREQGEFVLERVSEIARAAAVPLAGQDCHPNLFIVVTSQPKELLRAMENRRFAVTFGNATPSQVDAFINTPRPVRVWYGSYETGARDEPRVEGVPGSAQVLNGGLSGAPTYTSHDGPSRLIARVVYVYAAVYVVADLTELRGVSQGQLADYVAMVGLAGIKTSAHTGDTKTILTLFAGAPSTAPPGMSDWDQAFLRSLYATAHDSTLQRSLIVRSMARELVPGKSSPTAP